MEFNSTDVEIEKRADQIFDSLDDYAKFSLWQHGTAFTTYEDLGEDICAVLNRRARAWRAYQEKVGGFNCK